MIIYGTGEKRRVLDKNKMICPNCRKQSLKTYVFNKYFHLFWIPVFPYGKRTIVICEDCQITYQDKAIPDEIQTELSFYRSMTRPPIYLFSGAILILAAVLWIIQSSTGPQTYKYESGNIQAKGKTVRDEMDGMWTFWHENGNIYSKQYYHEGIEDSTWSWWFEDGTLSKTGNYKNGMAHGEWVYYYPSGQKEAQEIYFENRLQGKSTYWYENGQIHSQGNYSRNLSDGFWTYWYESGKKNTEGLFDQGEKKGLWITYHENGSEMLHVEYKDSTSYIQNYWDSTGKQLVKDGNGVITSYYENGNIESKGNLSNGKSVGEWRYWYPEGTLKESGNFKDDTYLIKNFWDKDGKQIIENGNGDYLVKYDNGVVATKGAYVNGLKNGNWIYRYESDQLAQESYFEFGVAQGDIKNYFPNGALQIEGKYENNLEHGLWRWYFEGGQTESEVEFVHGVKEGEQKFWNESGIIVKKEFYRHGELIEEETN